MKLKRKMMSLAAAIALASQTYASPPTWSGNDHFKITSVDSSIVKIFMEKMPWESFSVDVRSLQEQGNMLSFGVKSPQSVYLKIDGFTASGKQVNLLNVNIEEGNFQQIYFDLSQLDEKIDNVIFYVNPGEKYKGDVFFKKVGVVESANALSVFPNPSSDVVKVSLPAGTFETLSVYNQQGQLVLQRPVTGASVTLNVKGLDQGMYVIKAHGSDASLVTSTFIVQ